MRRFFLLLSFLTTLFTPASWASEIDAEGLLSKPVGEFLILDVRRPDEYARGHVPGAINIPHNQVAGNLDKLMAYKDKPIAYYCKSGYRAGKAADILKANGFRQLYHLRGDMKGWQADKRPVEK